MAEDFRKIVYTGLESSGKSLLLSREANKLLKRATLWNKITGKPRTLAFNMQMSPSFIREVENAGLTYMEWESFHQIENLTGADIFIDELLKIFPQKGSEPLPAHLMDFLTQGAKSGLHMVATSQDFSQVHKQFRLLVSKVYVVKKIMGSPRPHETRPPVTSIWGVCLKNSVKPSSFKGDNATMEKDFMSIPFFIRKKDTERYNTLHKVPRAELPALKLRRQRVYAEDKDGNIIMQKYQFR